MTKDDVYDAFKDIITGTNVNLGSNRSVKNKTIKGLIQQYSQAPRIKALLKSYSLTDLSNEVRKLSNSGRFTPPATAAVPAVPVATTLPCPSSSHIDVGTSVSPITKLPVKVSGAHKGTDSFTIVEPSHATVKSDDSKTARPNPALVSESKATETTIAATKLDSIPALTSLPYDAQYSMLSQMQQVLERACFRFFQDNLPAILLKNNWDCWEAAELNFCVKELAQHPSKLPGFQAARSDISISKMVASLTELRNCAVHRHRLTGSQLNTFLEISECLLNLLKDGNRLEMVKRWHQEFLKQLGELDGHEQELAQSFESVQEVFAIRRRELQQREETAVSKIEERIQNVRRNAGQMIAKVFASEGKECILKRHDAPKVKDVTVIIASGLWTVISLFVMFVITTIASVFSRILSYLI
ncbi:hypothetical protein QQS21_010388 [Conoideocrella luteorostrata]|uniref:Uncharacterized protein n=1 Tax=Conoideocrella luteorostrata TaxID=1105319 RepID=A0AAJ0FU86_9HYPO|nr:hypothetical protein QQS21_010388 [Conoideocrella luteorostrata]